ncbi:hypothetical protein SAMN05421688_3042 [Poseidonocella pacifica]|uniref:Uncharacterized protein n=1 Tax=Poseidonocella pacifica TaxID=871651 RepID=A0A1I0YIW8_9RHOB|nr:hypothetical protein [Poseidonocella pacifica]SFB12083.1 hypothetical protein SAMN05421688_3042 [Poseidonocella pacifica]
MIELAFVACLVTVPDHCENRSMLFTDITPMQCAMGAQPELAKWVGSHASWRVREWRCAMRDKTALDA